MSLIDDLGTELGKKRLPMVHVGDTVNVHYLIKEGDKERVQIFTGTVLAITGRGIAKSITRLTPENIWIGAMIRSMPENNMAMAADIIRAKPIGMPMAIMANRRMTTPQATA